MIRRPPSAKSASCIIRSSILESLNPEVARTPNLQEKKKMPTSTRGNNKLLQLLIYALRHEANFTPKRATVLAAHFASLEEFLNVEVEKLKEIRSVSGKRILSLTNSQVEAIKRLQRAGILSSRRDVPDNLLVLITREFVRKQVRMLDELTLDRMSPNPFLIKSLNLQTPREVVELNVYMFATRSIVTSMGFFVEKLLLASSNSAAKCERPWDILKTNKKGKRHWIQVKSGPNDMDADQIRLWAGLIAKTVSKGDNAYIGTTYGKRTRASVTLGLLRTYLPDWEKRTLIGRELWDFISEDPTYHEKLFPMLAEASSQVLGNESIEERIQRRIETITQEFSKKYGVSNNAVKKYLADIF
jgi:hypothetical protein